MIKSSKPTHKWQSMYLQSKISLNLSPLTDIILTGDKSILKVTASSEIVYFICSEACENVVRYIWPFFHSHGKIILGLKISHTEVYSEKSWFYL